MNPNNVSLEKFFREDIFELDSDEVEDYVSQFPEIQVNKCLSEKLKILAGDQDTIIEEPWKLGRKFGGFKKSSADEYILKKIYDANQNIKEAYFEFLSGFWERICDDQLLLVKEYSDYVVKLLPDSKFNQEFIKKLIGTFATAYLYNKSICEKELCLYNNFEIIKKYAQKSMVDDHLKEFILSS